LTLELDRIPVHAATIAFLSTHYGSTPGVEETCLHHALHIKDNHQQMLYWLMRCAHVAKSSMRHALFVQRAMQLLSVAVKDDPFAGQEDFEINVSW
jgi:hypothetical protein